MYQYICQFLQIFKYITYNATTISICSAGLTGEINEGVGGGAMLGGPGHLLASIGPDMEVVGMFFLLLVFLFDSLELNKWRYVFGKMSFLVVKI